MIVVCVRPSLWVLWHLGYDTTWYAIFTSESWFLASLSTALNQRDKNKEKQLKTKNDIAQKIRSTVMVYTVSIHVVYSATRWYRTSQNSFNGTGSCSGGNSSLFGRQIQWKTSQNNIRSVYPYLPTAQVSHDQFLGSTFKNGNLILKIIYA